MSFTKGKVRDFYLLSTDVENIFINEYMPGAPGDYVKVYLYGLLYAQQKNSMSHQLLSSQLGLSPDQTEKAWAYWEEMGIVKRHFNHSAPPFNFTVEFLSIREKMYGNIVSSGQYVQSGQVSVRPEPDMSAAHVLVNDNLKTLLYDIEDLMGRTLSSDERGNIAEWMKQDGATEDLIREAYRYCCEKSQTGIRYIGKVVMAWNEKGLRKKEDILEYIGGLEERYALYRKVLNSLGLRRNPTSAEKKMIDEWVDSLGFNEERILAACDTTLSAANPNLRYVNKVLESWHNEAGQQGRDVNQKITVTQAVLNKYYEFLREEAEAKALQRKEEVYEAVPQIAALDTQLTGLGSKLSRGLLSGMTKEEINEARRLMAEAEEERAVLLTENNFTVDYTDIRYSCEKCSDTGLDENGQRCECAKDRMREAEIWQNHKR
ncbi:MAG: DnaD domain protein [Firmicutes bacterium]|nr:DnaD domain protein [Bacillota bacterium]